MYDGDVIYTKLENFIVLCSEFVQDTTYQLI